MRRMNPLTYSLCQKPVLGLVMFATSMCAFPPLFQDAALPLQQAGARLVEEFETPVGKSYLLELEFRFPSAASLAADEVVGSRYDQVCLRNGEDIPAPQGSGLGRSIPVHVEVREQRSGALVIDKTFHSLCVTSFGGHDAYTKTRTVGRLDLPAGRYRIDVRNLESQAGLDGVKTTVLLVAGHGK